MEHFQNFEKKRPIFKIVFACSAPGLPAPLRTGRAPAAPLPCQRPCAQGAPRRSYFKDRSLGLFQKFEEMEHFQKFEKKRPIFKIVVSLAQARRPPRPCDMTSPCTSEPNACVCLKLSQPQAVAATPDARSKLF